MYFDVNIGLVDQNKRCNGKILEMVALRVGKVEEKMGGFRRRSRANAAVTEQRRNEYIHFSKSISELGEVT